MLRNPVTLLSWLAIGSAIEPGTLPSAASCSTNSAERHARRQVSSERISPSMKRKFRHWPSATASCTCARLRRLPIEKLSSPITRWSSLSRVSRRFEPTNPATPVTSQVRGRVLKRPCTASYVVIPIRPFFRDFVRQCPARVLTPAGATIAGYCRKSLCSSCVSTMVRTGCPDRTGPARRGIRVRQLRFTRSMNHGFFGRKRSPTKIQKQSLVAVYHRPFRKEPFNHIAGVVSHSSGNRPVSRSRQLVDEGSRITHRKEKPVPPRDDHLRSATDIGMDKRPAQSHGLDRRQGERLCDAAHNHGITGGDIGTDVLLESSNHDITPDIERARAGLDRSAHLAVTYQQRTGRDTPVAEHGDRLDQLQMVLFRAQQRRYADHAVRVGKTEHAA